MARRYDHLDALRARLAKLKTLCYSPGAIDYDRMSMYQTDERKKAGQIKVNEAKPISRRHELMEEMVLTEQHLARAIKKAKLKSWEAEFLEYHESNNVEDCIRWIRIELKEKWDAKKVRQKIYEIKKRMGLIEEAPKRQSLGDVLGLRSEIDAILKKRK